MGDNWVGEGGGLLPGLRRVEPGVGLQTIAQPDLAGLRQRKVRANQ